MPLFNLRPKEPGVSPQLFEQIGGRAGTLSVPSLLYTWPVSSLKSETTSVSVFQSTNVE